MLNFPLGQKVENIKRKSLKGKQKPAMVKGKGSQSYKNKQLLAGKNVEKKIKSEKEPENKMK